MAFVNFSSLQSSSFQKSATLNESLRSFSNTATHKVFLSYRHRDREFVSGVVRFLHDLDPSIYVDYLDDELNNAMNSQTAPILRKRILQSKKLIQILSPNSGESKWMPWELGLGDGILGYANTVILPGVVNYSSTIDQDYLKMYGKIETANSKDGTINGWAVTYPDGTGKWFKQWLQS